MRKKVFLLIIPIMLILSGIILLILENNGTSYAEYVFIPRHNNIKSMSLSKSEKYKQELTNKSLDYMNRNNVSLSDGLELNASDISKSNDCSGSLKYTGKGDVYKQEFNINCSNDEKKSSSKLLYSLVNTKMIDIKGISDGYITTVNYANIMKYNNNYDLLWEYDYALNGQNLDENTYLLIDANDVVESDDKLFFIISFISSSGNNTANTALLILNKDGSLYKEHKFEESIRSILEVNGDNVILYGYDLNFYVYNYKTEELNNSTINVKNEHDYELIGKNGNNYLMMSYIEADYGTNSLYLLDEKLNIKNSLNLDKVIRFSHNKEKIEYQSVKIIDNKIYVLYNTTKYDNEISKLDYTGLLIIDKDFNVISDIKYVAEYEKNTATQSFVYQLFDYFVYANNIYTLSYDTNNDFILIDKFNMSGKKVLSSIKREADSLVGLDKNDYTVSINRVVNFNDKNFTYYVMMHKNTGTESNYILKLVKVFI